MISHLKITQLLPFGFAQQTTKPAQAQPILFKKNKPPFHVRIRTLHERFLGVCRLRGWGRYIRRMPVRMWGYDTSGVASIRRVILSRPRGHGCHDNTRPPDGHRTAYDTTGWHRKSQKVAIKGPLSAANRWRRLQSLLGQCRVDFVLDDDSTATLQDIGPKWSFKKWRENKCQNRSYIEIDSATSKF